MLLDDGFSPLFDRRTEKRLLNILFMACSRARRFPYIPKALAADFRTLEEKCAVWQHAAMAQERSEVARSLRYCASALRARLRSMHWVAAVRIHTRRTTRTLGTRNARPIAFWAARRLSRTQSPN